MLKKLAWCLLILSLLLAGLLSAAWLQLPVIINYTVKHYLQDYGLESFDSGAPYLGFTGAGSQRITLHGRYRGMDYRVELNQVQAGYHWQALRHGRLQQLEIADITGDIGVGAQSETTPISGMDLNALVEQLAAFQLPVEETQLNSLNLKIHSPDTSLQLTGNNLILNNTRQQVTGGLAIQILETTRPLPGGMDKIELKLDKPGSLPWVPDLEMQVNSQIPSQLELRLHPGRTEQGYQLQLAGSFAVEALQPLLAGFDIELPGNANGKPLPALGMSSDISATIKFPGVIEFEDPQWLQAIAVIGTLNAEVNILHPDNEPLQAQLATTFELSEGDPGWRVKAILGIPEWQVSSEVLVRSDSRINPMKAEGQSQLELSGIFQAADLQPLLEAGMIGLPESLTANALPRVGVNGDFLVNMALPGLAGTDNPAWMQSVAVNGALNTDVEIARPDNGQLQARLATTFELPEGHPGWRAKAALSIPEWQVNSHWQADLDVSQNEKGKSASLVESLLLLLQGEVSLDNLPHLLGGVEVFGWKLPALQLASGGAKLKLNAGMQGRELSRLTLDIGADKLAGIYEGVGFAGASVSLPLSWANFWQSGGIDFSAESVSSGVVAKQLQARVKLKSTEDFTESRWQLDALKADIFGGQIAVTGPIEFDYPFSGHTFPVTLSSIHLDKLLALYQEQGVSGSGILDGQIPVTMHREGISISGGEMHSRDAGKLAYRSAAPISVAHEQLAMTLRLLENFNYDKLRVGLEFEPSGKLLLATQLSGRNPAEFDGRQVNFNINLEENLYDLFRVLRLTDQLTRELERRVRKHSTTRKE